MFNELMIGGGPMVEVDEEEGATRTRTMATTRREARDTIRPLETERNRARVILALIVCLLVFFSEQQSYSAEQEKKRLRSNHASEAANRVVVPSEVALNVFRKRLNGTIPYNVSVANVFVGEWAPITQSSEGSHTASSIFDIGELSHHQHQNGIDIPDVDKDPVKVISVVSATDQQAAPQPVEEVETPPANLDRSLRWNLDIQASQPTSLEGAHRIKGRLLSGRNGVTTVLEGIHMSRLGRMTLFTDSYQRSERVLGLITALPEGLDLGNSSDNSPRNLTLLPKVLRGTFGGPTGVAFGQPVEPSPAAYPGGSEDSELFPGCAHPIRFDLTVAYDEHEQHPLGATIPAVSFSGKGTCRNTSVSFVVTHTRSLMLDTEGAARDFSRVWVIVVLDTITVGALISQLLTPPEANQLWRHPDDLATLSMGAFGWLALTEVYLFQLLLNASSFIGGDVWWMTLAFIKGLQLLLMYVPLLVSILMTRNRLNGGSNESLGRMLNTCISRTQLAWFMAMVSFELMREKVPRIFAITWVSFWIPQIYCTATMNVRAPVTTPDVIRLSGTRVLFVLHAMAYQALDTLAAADRFAAHTSAQVYDIQGAIMALTWLALQVLIIHLQGKRGPQFFVPKCLRPKVYDYHADKKESFVPGEECVVCMQPINEQDVVVTPCKHHFHEDCLRPWLQMKRTCPTCRATLPPMLPVG